MAVSDRQILTIVEPNLGTIPEKKGKINLEEMSIEDNEEQKHELAPRIDEKESVTRGRHFPYIKINSNKINEEDLEYFELSVGGFIPTVSISLKDTKDKFKNIDFPKDGDLIAVYIRPTNIKKQKKIRCDFDITSTSVSSTSPAIFKFEGSMRIPGLYAEKIEGFAKETSMSHLGDVCTTLGIGFASNEESTDDSMIRLRASETYMKFIKDTTESSWKDEKSFFTSFIDPYYYLNFVNVNKQFSEEKEYEQVPISLNLTQNARSGDGDDKEISTGDFYLTNSIESQGQDNYIQHYGLITESGRIWMTEGYKRYSQHFDLDTFEFISEFVDPLTTEGSESKLILMKGKAGDESYKEQIKYKYLGKQETDIDDEGGVHLNHTYAKIQNYQNLREINKMKMVLQLDNTNFNIYRFQRVPLDIYTADVNQKALVAKRDEILGEEMEDTKDINSSEGYSMYRNEFLSGFYVIESYSYLYRRGSSLKQKINLVRREWPIPAESLDD